MPIHDARIQRGLFLPPFDVLADPGVVADVAVEAEAAGWDGVFLWDHLVFAEPVRAIADPWICCAAIASRTSRIRFGPMVTPLSRRRPQVVARQAVSLDRLSGGRLILGFGLGDDGSVRELSRFGEVTDARSRAAMLDEGLEVLRELLSGEEVDHEGRHVTAQQVTFLPTAVRPGGIPIWIGGRWPHRAPLRRAARYDGLFVISVDEPGDLAAARQVVEDLRVSHGGSMAGFEMVVRLAPGADVVPWADAGATWALTQLGPYDFELAEVQSVVRSGP